MANIVAVTRFCEATGNAFAHYIDYIDRDPAARNKNYDKFDLFSDYLNYMGDERKSNHADETTSNLFSNSSDSMTGEDKRTMKAAFKTAQQNGSNMWQTVISFDNQYLVESGVLSSDGILNEKKLMQATRKAVSAMLDAESLNNAVWAGAFHYNTDNIHIHLAITEPVPLREKKMYRQWERDEDGKIKTKVNAVTGKREKIPVLDHNGNQVIKPCYKGTFKNKSIYKLKSVMVSEINKDKEATIAISKLLRGIVNDKKSKTLMNDPQFYDMLQDLYSGIKKTNTEWRYWNYNQKTFSHLRHKIDDLSDFFITRYHEHDYNELIAKMNEKAAEYKEAYGGENDYMKNKLYDSKDGLYTRLGNAILKELRDYDKILIEHKRQVNLAQHIMLNGNREERDKAAENLISYANEGSTYAQNKLGIMYLKGQYFKRDVDLARQYFEKTANKGDTLGQEMLARLAQNNYNNNHNFDIFKYKVRKDFRKAVSMLKRSMETEYIRWRNKQSYEELQREIEERGTDI